MKRKIRFAAAALSCALLLTGCGAARTEPLTEEPPAEGNVIAYVPLDDRPDNVERVVYLAESLGYVLEMPEADLYRTRLDGQPLNENGTQHGDMAALYEWVLEQEAAGCDRYILSLDQLLSGGLVQSRCETGRELIPLSDGRALTDRQLLEELLKTLAEDPSNRVWLLDSVMRLAPTVGYAEGTTELYNWIRAFGMEPRETLEGAALTVERILESYWTGPTGEDLYDKTARQQGAVSAEEFYGPYKGLAENMDARERKLRLSDEVQHILARPGYENFRLLIGIDDSSLEDCIQKNEIAYLRQGLRTGTDGWQQDWLLSGVDDLAFKAVTKLYLEETGWSGSAAVRYFGGTEDQPACAYDFQPLTTVMAEHFDFFRLTESANPLAAQLQILVLTQPADESQVYFTQLIDALQECRNNRQPVILVDASNNRYGTAFHDALVKEAELGWLLSYAGFLDMAIVTGTALSHGVARYAFLQTDTPAEASERAFARTLADSIVKDFCYRNVVREDLAAYVREAGGDPNNFWVPEIDRAALLERLERGMADVTPAVVKNLERSNLIVSLEPYTERGWGGISLESYRFPWDRVFEIGMDIRLGEFTEPHQQVLGVYVR